MNLNTLLQPVKKLAFFESYWEQKPLHIQRDRAGYFSEIGDFTKVGDFLAGIPDNRHVKVISDDQEKPAIHLEPDGRQDTAALFEWFDNGYTLVVYELHKRWPSVMKLAQELAKELGFESFANVYATPAQSVGFGAHWDADETIVLQLDGEKEWLLFENGPDLPRKKLQSHADTKDLLVAQPGPPSQQLTLKPGDLLYMPRGTIHRAFTREHDSIHLSIGIRVISVADYLIDGIAQLAQQKRWLRQGLKPGQVLGEGPFEAWFESLDIPGDLPWGDLNHEQLHQSLGSRLLASLVSIPKPWDHKRRCARSLTMDTVLVRTSHEPFLLRRDDDRVSLELPGRLMSGPSKLYWAFHMATEKEWFRIADLPPIYNEGEKIVIARNFIRKGVFGLAPADFLPGENQ